MNWNLQEQGWRLLPGSLTALAIALLLKLGTLQPLEQIAYRLLYQTRGALPWDDRLALVAIDDASLKQLGRFPWPRQQYIKLLKVMDLAQAELVVVDLIWSEASPEDRRLAEAMSQQGHVVLAQAWDATGMLLLPVPQLGKAAIASGHVMKREDSDGIVRRVDLQIAGVPTLGVAVMQAHSLIQAPISLPPLDQPFWVNWVSPAQQLRQYSFVDVISGKVPAQVFQDKIVLVGVTAAGLDPLVTPFDRNPSTGSVHLHATIIHNLLQQNYLRPIQTNWFWLILLLGGPGLSWLMATRNTRQQLAVITGLCLSWGMLSLLLFHSDILLPTVFPIVLFTTTAIAVSLGDRLRENYLLRRQVAEIWEQYRQDLVISTADSANPLVPMQKQQLPQPDEAVLRIAQLAALAEQFGRSQSTQAAIARTLSVGLLAADLDGTVWFCNPAATQWLKVTVGSCLNDPILSLLTQEQWQSSLEALKAGRSINPSNLNQGDQWFEMILKPLVYNPNASKEKGFKEAEQPHGKEPPPVLDGFLLLLEDVTDYKRAEVELHQAKDTAEAASRAKSEFLASVSHELRTPLNVILGFTQLMSRDRSLPLEHQEHLEIINRSGQHLLNLINDVLEMSKIEAGRATLNITSFNLHHLLAELEAMLRIKANAKSLTLVVERSPVLPESIKTDAGKLRQVLLNLLSNAIKFTQQGSVTLRVVPEFVAPEFVPNYSEQEAIDPEQLTIRFEVQDTGCGIAAAEIEELFHPFIQASAGQQASVGTGLGLAISRKFISLMGGNITVDSIPNQGSTFRFNIQAERVETPNRSALQLQPGRIISLAADQPIYRILIVEDRWENSLFLVKLLQAIGFDVLEVRNGEEGVSQWQSWKPHLILMDLQMPIIDGYEATRQIRALESKKKIPPQKRTKIIALTARAFDSAQIVLAAGCDDCLHKPVHEDTVLATLADHLGVRYVYGIAETKDNPGSVPPALSPMADSLSVHLTQMPPTWIQQLYREAVKGADRPIFQLIEQIPAESIILASTLETWVKDFQFDYVIDLIQRIRG